MLFFYSIPPVFPGTDGLDYPSECHLEKAACDRRQVSLVVRYPGRCNPCQTISCDDSKECHLAEEDDEDYNGFGLAPWGSDEEEVEEGDGGDEAFGLPKREPKCLCDTDCSQRFTPVCASNGKTVRGIRHLLYMGAT